MTWTRSRPRWTAALALTTAVVALTALAGCGSGSGGGGTPTASAATRTVVDMTGRHVRIPATVTRVATNIPLIPPTMALLGGGKDLVAAPSGTASALSAKVAPLPKNVLLSPVSSVNADALLKAAPQVFIMTSLTQGLLPTLNRLHIPVVEISGFTTPADLEHGVTVVADVLGGGAPARARQFTSTYQADLAQARTATASLATADQPTVYYAPGPDPTTTVGNGNIITPEITAAGGRNIAAEHGIGASQPGSFAFPTVTTETLLSWNPQVIVAIDTQVARQFLTDPKYAGLSAVRDHHVYACPSGVADWCASSAEAALAPLFLAKTLHPQQFGGLDLAAKTKEFYATYYGYHLSDQQVSSILATP